jgi:hypothetical protein
MRVFGRLDPNYLEGGLMKLSEISDVRLQTKGVMFKYLLFEIEQSGEKKKLVRGVNYQPYHNDVDDQIVQWVREELREGSFFEKGGDFRIEGGGTITLNPYSETLAVFGASVVYGEEENREDVAKMFERAFPDHEVSWSDADSQSKKETSPASKAEPEET